MVEENSGIYGKPKFGMIVWMFAIAIVVVLVAGWIFLKSGHPNMHVQPQPRDNKGALSVPGGGLSV